MQRLLTLVAVALLWCKFSVLSSSAAAANPVAKPHAEILWDKWGTPHIFAAEEEEAFRAFGWAQWRATAISCSNCTARRAGGRLNFGADFLTSDRAVRAFGLYDLARKWYQAQNPKFRRNLDAFATGINEYARQNPNRLQSDVKAALPVDGGDVMGTRRACSTSFLVASVA